MKEIYGKIKKIFLNKYFVIVSQVFLFVVLIVIIWFLRPLAWFNGWGESLLVKNKPVDNTISTTTTFGVVMQNKCFVEFQDFLKNYGQDYSKCLTDFDFNEAYCGGVDPSTEKLSNTNIVVILDASGSMASLINSQPKIDIAKKAIADFLTQMPQGVNTGLIVYGHKGSSSLADKNLSCKGIEEVVKLGPNNSSNIIGAMDSFTPKGWTPIAGSLEFTKDIFTKAGANDKDYLVLVSDGIESCDGDPLVAAEDLKAVVPGINLDIIGFTADIATENFLEKIANLDDGSYLTAGNSSEISNALSAELLVIKKDCVYTTFSQLSSRYNDNYFNNLNCWFSAYHKETDDFTENVVNKSTDTECNLEMAKALKARQNEFWDNKETITEKNAAIYKKIQSDFNTQINNLYNPGS